MPEPQHGTVARYRAGCSCDACCMAETQAARARDKRGAIEDLGWADELWLEAQHTVHALPHGRRLAMLLRRTAEQVRDHSGVVVSPTALVELLHAAAGELDSDRSSGEFS